MRLEQPRDQWSSIFAEPASRRGRRAWPSPPLPSPRNTKEAPMLAEHGQGRQAAAGRAARCPPIPSSFRSSSGPVSTAACGAAPSSGPPTSTTTCASSTTRSAASRRTAPRSSRRSPPGWQSSPDFKIWTIRLRKGARWSDGAPFTADDIVFWYEDVVLNKDLTPVVPGWLRNCGRHRGVGREGRRPDGPLHATSSRRRSS
mgnify:CR=1 FL=1